MKKSFVITVISLVAMMSVLVGCTWSTAGQFNAAQEVYRATEAASNANVSFDQGKYDHGQSVYLKQYCGSCHTLDALKTTGTFGPAHNQIGTTAAQRVSDTGYTGHATDAQGYLHESLIDPHLYSAPGFEGTNHHMPAYTHLAEEDLNDLVYFLANQK
jgi:mono/diheme cytochrome c family protein